MMAVKGLLAGGLILAAAEAPAAPNDRGALYVAISGVLVSIVSAYAVIATSRNKAREPAPAPFLLDDEFTDNLTGLYRDAEHRAAKAELVAEMWKARAQLAGWSEEQQ